MLFKPGIKSLHKNKQPFTDVK